MEEILASIRQIISEDGEGNRAAEAKRGERESTDVGAATDAAKTEFEGAAAEPEPIALDSVEPEPEFEPESDFEPEPEPESEFAHGEPMTPPSSGSAAEADPYAPFAASPRPHPQDESSTAARPQISGPGDAAQRLLSSESGNAVHGAFSALAHTILAQNARTLEDLVAEMLQPMLKDWLDENLPQLVERLVQEEIQRVSRGGR
jgi:hypothetical protein